MANQTQYFAAITLDPYFVNKSTGEALSGGTLYFWEDANRSIPKNVYEQVQISGTNPPQYQYTQLPNPVVLSGVGTVVDSNGNNVAMYYYPYDLDGEVQQYYVECYDANGLLQWTREAWPALSVIQGGDDAASSGAINNQISNSQFVDVNFDVGNNFSVAYTGSGTTSVDIAPDWTLNLSHTGAGTVTIARTAVAGSSAYPYNPPYLLTVTTGNNLTEITLTQTLQNNPDWGAPQTSTSTNGYLAGSILLSPGMSITMNYLKSAGLPSSQTIVSESNLTATYLQVDNTIQLAPASNTQTGDTGYDTIELVLPVTGTYSFSNVQVVALSANITGLPYCQDTVNRQKDYLFHYYNPLLQAKVTSSYLECWDFPLNPAQFLSSSVAAQAVGANKSYYVWDQTILFQSADSGITTSRNTTGGLRILSAPVAGTQMAVIQYQEGFRAREILNNKLNVVVSAKASVATTVTISLWYTSDVSLPNIASGTNNSLVATLDANGKPATFNGNWTEVPRSFDVAPEFDIGTNATSSYNEYGFTGWDMEGDADIASATYFAIVVGTESMAQNAYLDIESISLVPGEFATKPAPQTYAQVLSDAQRYYEKSFDINVVPAVNVSGGEYGVIQVVGASSNTATFTIPYKTRKRATSNVVVYNPNAANNQLYNIATASSTTNTTVVYTSQGGFLLSYTTTGGSSAAAINVFQWTSDARLGIV